MSDAEMEQLLHRLVAAHSSLKLNINQSNKTIKQKDLETSLNTIKFTLSSSSSLSRSIACPPLSTLAHPECLSDMRRFPQQRVLSFYRHYHYRHRHCHYHYYCHQCHYLIILSFFDKLNPYTNTETAMLSMGKSTCLRKIIYFRKKL